jgi:triosephosphate isomerase
VGKKLLIANWKMNLTIHEASLLVHKLEREIEFHRDVEIVLAPSFLGLQSLSLQIDHRHFALAAQDFYWRDEGAFTGEVSAHQLDGLVEYALVGHSERRHVFNEKSRDIRFKVQAAFRNNITPILCIGETANEHANGERADVIHDQIVEGVTNITAEEAKRLVVAYEPVWAVGSGKHPDSPSDLEGAVRAIRSQLMHLFGEEVASSVRVLYGGNVHPDNAAGFLNAKGIDGLIIGGASLDAHAFSAIVDKAHESKGE